MSSEALREAFDWLEAIASADPKLVRPSGLAAALLAEVARLEQEAVELRRAWRANVEELTEQYGAALAVAREREQRAVKELERIAANAESWHGYLPADDAPGAGHVRALAVIATWARAALVEPAAATCICTRFSDLPEGTIIADLTCPVHGVNGTEPGDVLPDEYYAAADEPGETPGGYTPMAKPDLDDYSGFAR